ncbi:hypothetical protein C488_02955 [Natrinema pellirubrum DSM 15624]|uniref:Zn-dependent hydrolase, glyoxylase n=1 Tax=Natrinema pellirubrum (strain DSM 15624 / CIP 106293 / JCM 10476 / NCIMB 786 / 157) TaxID=797303 RepID=L0JKL6_NATP1|nr:hypothetical protein [Natrinema pellirubrum]AGB30901.1 hypothetical protein Natpe_0989 [Natrinema pellirubrum DSM 15624]ELY80713.1 hypothetical protein C488_02955 [Natrinema pellirubrum DSM 15624]
MGFRADERATEFREIDRFDGGVGWIAHPDERMQRASHALEIDGEVWVIDPVDAEGLDDLLAEFGDVAGVVVGLDRHKRDAATIANRHDVPVYLPEWFNGVTGDIDAAVARFDDELSDTGLRAITVVDNRFWQEVALYNPTDGTLMVPESVGSVDYFLTGDETLGVHPALRLKPPRSALRGVAPERVLVGHGAGVMENAAAVLEAALSRSRKRAPRLYAGTAWEMLPF